MKLSEVAVGDECMIRAKVLSHSPQFGTLVAFPDIPSPQPGVHGGTGTFVSTMPIHAAAWRPSEGSRVTLPEGTTGTVTWIAGTKAWVSGDDGQDHVVVADLLAPEADGKVVALRKP